MEITNIKWGAIAVAACAVTWFGLLFRAPVNEKPLPSNVPVDFFRRPLTGPRIIEARLGEANSRLRLLEIRDSVLRATTAKKEPFTVLVDNALQAEMGAMIDSVIKAQWKALAVPPSMEVVVAYVLDTATKPHGYPRARSFDTGSPIDVFLPSRETGGRCVAIARTAVQLQAGKRIINMVRQNLTSSETVAAVLAPCALYATFGEPGPQISQWLLGRWSLARFASWNSAPAPWTIVTRPGLGGSVRAPQVDRLTDPSWKIRGYVAPGGIACLAGEAGACKDIVMGGASMVRDTAWASRVVTSYGTSVSSYYFPIPRLNRGPAEGQLMSEMVRTLGPDTFAKFWRSPLPAEAAFKAASGQELDDWTRSWAQRTYGTAGVGPAFSMAGGLTGSIVIALGVAVAVLVERKRRVA